MAELNATGYEVEAVRPGPCGAPMFAFLTGACGFRIELRARAAEPGLARCWALVTGPEEGERR